MQNNNTTIIGISGKKQSGKTTLAEYVDQWLQMSNISSDLQQNCRIYSFADPLKQNVCMDVLGLTRDQVYGEDEEKNVLTPFLWDNLPDEIRRRYSNSDLDQVVGAGVDDEGNEYEYLEKQGDVRTGYMTARELMQVVGTDLFRNYFDDDVWVKATFNKIQQENPMVAIVADVRFPGEVMEIVEHGGYIIRLTRDVYHDSHLSETALDDFDFNKLGNQSLIIDNHDMDMQRKNEKAKSFVHNILCLENS